MKNIWLYKTKDTEQEILLKQTDTWTKNSSLSATKHSRKDKNKNQTPVRKYQTKQNIHLIDAQREREKKNSDFWFKKQWEAFWEGENQAVGVRKVVYKRWVDLLPFELQETMVQLELEIAGPLENGAQKGVSQFLYQIH